MESGQPPRLRAVAERRRSIEARERRAGPRIAVELPGAWSDTQDVGAQQRATSTKSFSASARRARRRSARSWQRNSSLKWDAMSRRSRRLPTLAAQLWTNKTAQDYEWPIARRARHAFVDPLDTWGDNSQYLKQEQWNDGSPQQLAYFVGNLFPVDDTPQ